MERRAIAEGILKMEMERGGFVELETLDDLTTFMNIMNDLPRFRLLRCVDSDLQVGDIVHFF